MKVLMYGIILSLMLMTSSCLLTTVSTLATTDITLNPHGTPQYAMLDNFINENSDAVMKDIAAGEGENIDAICQILEIEEKEEFSKKLQENFDNIYPDIESDAVASVIIELAIEK
jgi:hypothetical protein